MFACDHNSLKCFIPPDCWWYQFKTKIVWQEMISRALYYRCLNCFCLWLFPGNEYKWIEKCRWAWTASGEIDSTLPDISILKTDRVKEAARRPLPHPRPRCAVAGLDGFTWFPPPPPSCYTPVIQSRIVIHCSTLPQYSSVFLNVPFFLIRMINMDVGHANDCLIN